jgi:hypothetical protein
VFLYLLRKAPPLAGAFSPSPSEKRVLTGLMAFCAVYGLALLIVPSWVTWFWPWPVDAFHGRMYASVYIAPAVAAWVMRKQATSTEFRILGSALTVLGILSTVGVVWTSTSLPLVLQVNYASVSTWVFIAVQMLLLALGAALWSQGNRRTQAWSQRIPAIPLVRWFALGMGIAFTLQGSQVRNLHRPPLKSLIYNNKFKRLSYRGSRNEYLAHI